MVEAGLRIDKFLWYCRLAKTRGMAQTVIEAGHCRMDGRSVARAHVTVRPGNVLTFPLHDRIRVIRVDVLPPRRGPAPEARLCYTDLAPVEPAMPLSVENGSHPARDIDAPDRAT